jgi:hypothetical protein
MKEKMCRRRGRCDESFSIPTINVSVPAEAPAVPPETGASWNVGELTSLDDRTASPTLREVVISIVELKILDSIHLLTARHDHAPIHEMLPSCTAGRQ